MSNLKNDRANDARFDAALNAAASLGAGLVRSTLYRVEAFAPFTLRQMRQYFESFGAWQAFERRIGGLIVPRAEAGKTRFVVPVKTLARLGGLPDALASALFARPVWVESFHNLVVTAGLNDSLDKHFKGSGYTAAWYVGLTDDAPSFAAGDTMASHAGWAEVTAYSEATREALTLGTVAAGSVDNSASKASYSINGTTTVGGAFVTTNNTKGGSTGTLYGGGAFAADRSLLSGDTLNVTVTLTAAAA